MNLDVCFVPAEHLAQEKLPAVSGSSGHLVVERLVLRQSERQWPGQVFAEAELDYRQAMQRYVEATRDRLVRHSSPREPKPAKEAQWREDMARRLARFYQLEQRKREDAGWKAIRKRHHTIVVAYRALSQRRRKEQQAAWQAELNLWKQVKARRKARLEIRSRENQIWHQRQPGPAATNEAARESRVWIAILVVTDNCTRQCLALPVFRSGAKLTSEEVVGALRGVLPAQLEFLISDQGTHFRSNAFAQLVREADFIHVPVYRYRPESNGIAERFVLTLKQWLRDKPWQFVEALELLLAQFLTEYNDRPHQGLAIPGLSPSEFAKRIWLM